MELPTIFFPHTLSLMGMKYGDGCGEGFPLRTPIRPFDSGIPLLDPAALIYIWFALSLWTGRVSVCGQRAGLDGCLQMVALETMPNWLVRHSAVAGRRIRIGPDSPIRRKTGRLRTCRRRSDFCGVFVTPGKARVWLVAFHSDGKKRRCSV